MPRNVEIKAAVDDLSVVQRVVESIADEGPIELHQTDTFFSCTNGWLKVRELSGASAELIYYQRTDEAGPRESVFLIAPVSEPERTKQILSASNGSLGMVKKRRLLYLIGQTRVHLDQVEGLGQFVELEVVLQGNQSTDEGVAVANGLMEALNIHQGQLIDSAYFDLLQGVKA